MNAERAAKTATQNFGPVQLNASGPPWDFVDWLRAHAGDEVTEVRSVPDDPRVPASMQDAVVSWTTEDGEDHTNTVNYFMREHVPEE